MWSAETVVCFDLSLAELDQLAGLDRRGSVDNAARTIVRQFLLRERLKAARKRRADRIAYSTANARAL